MFKNKVILKFHSSDAISSQKCISRTFYCSLYLFNITYISIVCKFCCNLLTTNTLQKVLFIVQIVFVESLDLLVDGEIRLLLHKFYFILFFFAFSVVSKSLLVLKAQKYRLGKIVSAMKIESL